MSLYMCCHFVTSLSENTKTQLLRSRLGGIVKFNMIILDIHVQ